MREERDFIWKKQSRDWYPHRVIDSLTRAKNRENALGRLSGPFPCLHYLALKDGPGRDQKWETLYSRRDLNAVWAPAPCSGFHQQRDPGPGLPALSRSVPGAQQLGEGLSGLRGSSEGQCLTRSELRSVSYVVVIMSAQLSCFHRRTVSHTFLPISNLVTATLLFFKYIFN